MVSRFVKRGSTSPGADAPLPRCHQPWQHQREREHGQRSSRQGIQGPDRLQVTTSYRTSGTAASGVCVPKENMRRARSAGAAREAPRLVAARDLEPPPQARGADAERADGVIRMTEIWPCVRTWNPSIGLHACCCVPSAPARNRLLASAMNQTKLPLSGRGTIPLARYRRAGRPRPKTRMVRPLPNTAPFHKASSRWYRAGTRPIETVSLHGRRSSPAAAHFPREPPYPVPENAERGAFLLRRRQLRYGLSDATPDGPWNRPRLRLPNIPLLRHGSEIGLRDRDLPGKEGGHGLEGAGLALPDAGLSDANPDGTYSQLRCTRRYPAGAEPLVIAAFRPPSVLPEPP